MPHDFYHMSIGAGLALSTITICVLILFRMMLELLFDLIESAQDK